MPKITAGHCLRTTTFYVILSTSSWTIPWRDSKWSHLRRCFPQCHHPFSLIDNVDVINCQIAVRPAGMMEPHILSLYQEMAERHWTGMCAPSLPAPGLKILLTGSVLHYRHCSPGNGRHDRRTPPDNPFLPGSATPGLY